MYTGASWNVSVCANASETSTSAGNRKAAIWATEFFTTEIARSKLRLRARTRPVKFSTAFPAMATITSPANAFEIPRVRIAGSRAWMNQSDTKAEPVPAAASTPSPIGSGSVDPCGTSVAGPVSLRR